MARVWIVTGKEIGMPETILWDRDETGQYRELVFAESAYAQAVQAFNAMRDDRLSFHKVHVVGTFGPDAHAHLNAYDGDDMVELRPIEVIGG
jgi:cytochrome oxidase assembly protein ShyY1